MNSTKRHVFVQLPLYLEMDARHGSKGGKNGGPNRRAKKMTVTRAELGIDSVVEEGAAKRREGESVPFSSLFSSRQLSCVVQLPCLLHREEGATMRFFLSLRYFLAESHAVLSP